MHPVGIPHAKQLTIFEVCSPNNFQDIWDRLPQFLVVTWPRPCPNWGKLLVRKLLVRPIGFPQTKRCTKFEVSSSSSFDDMLDCMPKIRGVTWRPRLFWEKLLERPNSFSKRKLNTKFKVSSLSSFENMFECMPKILGVSWPRPRPLWGNLFEHPLSFPQMKLCTKFEVCSSSNFGDMFKCVPKILGVTWPRPRPLWGKIIRVPAWLSTDEAAYQIWSL